MKIRDIETYLVGHEWKSWLFLRVITDDGLYGIGEGSLGQLNRSVEGAVRDLKPMVIGMSPFDVEALVAKLCRDVYGDGGQIKMAAISAIEIACWDILGKFLGQPVYNLIGGRCHERLRAYANGWYRCDRTPEAFADRARKVVDMGYTAMKFDPFGIGWRMLTPWEEDLSIDIVRAVRDAVGPRVDLMIEAHSRFGVASAISIAQRLAAFRPAWFEEPVPHQNIQATIEVARASAVPIATGESLSSKQR
jgi:galactonate dehydratase